MFRLIKFQGSKRRISTWVRVQQTTEPSEVTIYTRVQESARRPEPRGFEALDRGEGVIGAGTEQSGGPPFLTAPKFHCCKYSC